MQKSNKLSLRVCAGLVVLSAFAYAARWVQNMSIFEADTGLASPRAGTSVFFVLYMVCAVLAMCALLLPVLRSPLAENVPAMRCPDGGAGAGCLLAAGALTALGGALSLLAASSTLPRILALLALAAGAAMALSARQGKTKADSALSALCALLPVAYVCFWLIVSYKAHAANPVIWAYAVEILALAIGAGAAHFLAGFAFGRPRLIAACIGCAKAALFCFAALADSRALAGQLALAGLGLYFIGSLSALTDSVRPVKPRH